MNSQEKAKKEEKDKQIEEKETLFRNMKNITKKDKQGKRE
jgi:hypothetical protein